MFWLSAKNYNFFEIFVNTGPYGAGKLYSSYIFIPSEPQFMRNKAVIRKCKVINDLVICQKLIVLWHFEMGVNGKILKCAISWKLLIIERNGQTFGTQGTTVHISRVHLMHDSLHFGLGSFGWSFGALGKISNFTIFITTPFPIYNFNFYQTLL